MDIGTRVGTPTHQRSAPMFSTCSETKTADQSPEPTLLGPPVASERRRVALSVSLSRGSVIPRPRAKNRFYQYAGIFSFLTNYIGNGCENRPITPAVRTATSKRQKGGRFPVV
jgi:hypothetical protein